MLSISGVLGPIYAALLFSVGGNYYTIIGFAAIMAFVSFVIFLLTNKTVEDGPMKLEIVMEAEEGLENGCT